MRLDGELANGTRWLTGVNLFRSDLDADFTSNSTGFIFGRFNNSFVNESYALFGEATVPFNDRLRLTGGARYTHERRKFSGQFTDLSGGTLGFDSSESGSLDFNLWTGRAALSYDLTPDVTGYVSAARGAKAGGFQLVDFDAARGLPTSTFQPAFTWTYETGLRGTVLNGILDVSTAAFFNDTTDEHVQVFEPITFQSVIENVDTETYGVEFETALRPVAGLTLSGGLALLHTEITKSADPSVQVGNEVPFAPSVTLNLAAEYAQPVVVLNHAGDAYLRAEYQFVGARTVDPQNTFDLESFDIVNLYAGWSNETFSLYGFVTNLFDETYAQTAFLFGASPAGELVSVGVPGEPRRFGVGLKYTF